ncbi:hypothetical protein QCA50_019583 [Cerrena zonata]|uniref:Uncharacterized protein n=1 Tax=Cerrena zonata TaxID=2478898 RepID=A0AAW0FLA6_9APHY
MSSSSRKSRRSRRSRSSSASNSNSDRDPIRISPSRHDDEVVEVERSVHENCHSGPDVSQLSSPVQSSQPLEAAPTPLRNPHWQEGEANTVPVDAQATPASENA